MNQEKRERVYAAQRAGIMSRLRDAWRIPGDRAEALVAAWEAEAARRGLAATHPQFWSEAERWLAARTDRRDQYA